MVEFAEDRPEPATAEGGKKISPVFAAVRSRGMINASMDALAKAFEDLNKEKNLGTRWEFYNPNITGGQDLVQFREGEGYIVVTWEMMPNQAETKVDRKGFVRRGDLVLMAAPRHIIQEQLRQDAAVANADIKAPEAAFKSSLDSRQVRRPSDGETDQAKGTGQIKVKHEEIAPPRQSDA